MEVYVRVLVALAAARQTRKGQGLVEYILVLAFISMVAVAIMTAIGLEVIKPFQTASAGL